MSTATENPPSQSLIGSRILVLREQRVMLDSYLAELYGVETKVLIQAVKRKQERFPADFMFQLEKQELAVLRSQIVTSSLTHGGRRTAPYAFTEQGVAMLSSVLNSSRAVAVNIEIMRTFVRIRALAESHEDLAKRLEQLPEELEDPHRLVLSQLALICRELAPLRSLAAHLLRKEIGIEQEEAA